MITKSRVNAYFGMGVIVLAGINFFIRKNIPLNINLDLPHDDTLQIDQALCLLNGDWLCSFNERTLIKNMGYPFILRVLGEIGDYKLIYNLILLFISLFVAYSIYKITKNKNLFIISFALISFNPLTFSTDFYRIYRDGFYYYIVLILIGILNFIYLYYKNKKLKHLWVLSIFLIILISLAGLIRENILGPYLFVGFVLVLIFSFEYKIYLFKFINVAIIILIFSLFNNLVNSYIADKNKDFYGVSLVNDYYSGGFPELIQTWISLDSVGLEDASRVPLDENKRKIGYEVSANLSKLESYLEDPNLGWRLISCEILNVCNDFAGGWVTWAIRDAVYLAIEEKNAESYQDFFLQANKDLESYCKNSGSCSARYPFPFTSGLEHYAVNEIFYRSLQIMKKTFFADTYSGKIVTFDEATTQNWEQKTELLFSEETSLQEYINEWVKYEDFSSKLSIFLSILSTLLAILFFASFLKLKKMYRSKNWLLVFYLIMTCVIFLQLLIIDISQFYTASNNYTLLLSPYILITVLLTLQTTGEHSSDEVSA